MDDWPTLKTHAVKAMSLRDDVSPPGRRSAAAARVSHASTTTHPMKAVKPSLHFCPVQVARGAPPAPPISTKKACWFVPSQPPQRGAMNARAASELRTAESAGNPLHNITQHCITPRINGGAPKERHQVGKSISRSKALPAAGYTTRRYDKLLRQSFVGPFSVCHARS